MVLAAFSFRYDAHLVPGLIENISPFVHGYVAWDDRAADQAMTPETTRRTLLLQEARRMGAKWILAVDPDERFEGRMAGRMPEMLAMGEGNLWAFSLREMFSPDAYRTDGVWGNKTLMRLFPMSAAGRDLTVPLHSHWIADTSGFTIRHSRINLYHLRMATPARRRLRRDLYSAADPARRFQRIGYDYLDDERGMVLEAISPGREFSPSFEEDHGLWSPDPGDIGAIAPDPMEPRLAFVAQSAAQQGHAAAYHAMQDLCAASPDDEDLPHLSASLALTAGMFSEAEGIASRLLAKRPDDLHALQLRLRSRIWSGNSEGTTLDVTRLQDLAPNSPVTRQLAALAGRESADFTAEAAYWRRWVSGPATCREGAAVARAAMATIVIGFRSPPELAAAVASLRAQDEDTEIVVVNSGGGEPERVLAGHLDHIRLIAVQERLFVGAARNIGIDASRAEVVAFLAGDCRAMPGWVSGRMLRHRAGALSVSTPVLPEGETRLLPIAINRLRYWARSPSTEIAYVAHFGRSYARRLFDEVGYFPAGLRVSEDDALNRLVDRIAPPIWAPDVLTTHRDPDRLRDLWRDNRQRGIRRADHPPFRAAAGRPDRAQWLAAQMRQWRLAGWKALDDDATLSPRQRSGAKFIQWIANRADRRGISEAFARLAAADAALARAENLAAGDPDAALVAARTAALLDPQDWRKAHRHGLLLMGRAREEAVTELRRAAALAPGEAAPIDALLRLLSERGAYREALAEAERAALASPRSRRHWELAAEAAHLADDAALALAHARRAFCAGPDGPWTHHRLAGAHRAAGNPVMAMFRDLGRKRLQAAAEERGMP